MKHHGGPPASPPRKPIPRRFRPKTLRPMEIPKHPDPEAAKPPCASNVGQASRLPRERASASGMTGLRSASPSGRAGRLALERDTVGSWRIGKMDGKVKK